MPLEGPNGQRFESFNECVNEISGDGTSQEEAQQICGSFTELDKESEMSNNNLKKRVIEYYEDFENVDVEKENTDEESFEFEGSELIKTNDERQIAYSIVLKADRPDLENDTFPSQVVEKAAHEFMDKFQDHNVEHEFEVDDVQPVESFIAPSDLEINGNDVMKGDWVMAVKVHDDELWKLMKDGKIRGFSVEGKATKAPLSEVQ